MYGIPSSAANKLCMRALLLAAVVLVGGVDSAWGCEGAVVGAEVLAGGGPSSSTANSEEVSTD